MGDNVPVLREIENCDHEQGLGAKGKGTSSETTCSYSNDIEVTLMAEDAKTGELTCTGRPCPFRRKEG